MSEDRPIFGKPPDQPRDPPATSSPSRGGDGPPKFSPGSDRPEAPLRKAADEDPPAFRSGGSEKHDRSQPTAQPVAHTSGRSARPIRPAQHSAATPAAPVRPLPQEASSEAEHSSLSPGVIGAIGGLILVVLAAAGFLALDESGFFFEPPDLEAGEESQLAADGSLTFDGGVLESIDGSSMDGQIVETAVGRPLEGSQSVRFSSDIVSAAGDVRVRFDLPDGSEPTDSGPSEGHLVIGREGEGSPWHPIPAFVDDDQLVADLGSLSDYAMAVVDYDDLADELDDRFASSSEARVDSPTCEQISSVEHTFSLRNEDVADPEVFICNAMGPDRDRTYFSVTNNRAQMLLLAAPEQFGMDRGAEWADPVFLRGIGLSGLQGAQSSAVIVEGGETATISLWSDRIGESDVIQTRYSFVDDMISTFLWGGGSGGFGAFSATAGGGAETKTVGGLDVSSQFLHTTVSECVGAGIEEVDVISEGGVITEVFAACVGEVFADGTGNTLAEAIRRVPGERLLTWWNQGLDNAWGEIEVTPGPTGDSDLAELWEQAEPPCSRDFLGLREEARVAGVRSSARIVGERGQESSIPAGRLIFYWPRVQHDGEGAQVRGNLQAAVDIVYVAEDRLECGRISTWNLEAGGKLVEVPSGEEAMRRILEGIDTDLLFRGSQERLDVDRDLRGLLGEIRQIRETNLSAVAASEFLVTSEDETEGCSLSNVDSLLICEDVNVFRTSSADGNPIASYRLIYSEAGIETIQRLER